MKWLKKAGLVALAVALAGTSAQAGEVRLGVAWHDITDTETGVDIQPQIIFNSPNWMPLDLEPYLTASTNTDGNLNTFGGGLQFNRDVAGDWFVEFQGGFVAHDGRIDLPPPWMPVERQYVLDNEKTYGCEVLFHLVPSVGRHLNDKWAASVYLEHLSHGKILCDNGKNEGIDNLGLRLHRKF